MCATVRGMSCFLRVFKFHMRFRVARGPPRVHRREEARSFVGGVWVGCRRFVNDLFRHTQMQSLGIKLLYARSRPSQPIVIRQPRTPYAHDSRRIQLTAAAANPLHRTAQTDRVHRRRTCHRRSSAGVSGERERGGAHSFGFVPMHGSFDFGDVWLCERRRGHLGLRAPPAFG